MTGSGRETVEVETTLIDVVRDAADAADMESRSPRLVNVAITDENPANVTLRLEEKKLATDVGRVPCPDCEHGTLQVSDAIYADCDTCDAAVLRNEVGL